MRQNENNEGEIILLLKNCAIFMSKMNSLLDKNTINNFQSTMKNLNSTTKKLDKMINDFWDLGFDRRVTVIYR